MYRVWDENVFRVCIHRGYIKEALALIVFEIIIHARGETREVCMRRERERRVCREEFQCDPLKENYKD